MPKFNRLTNKAKFLELHPEMNETFNSMAAIQGKVIFATRMEKGLTQKELADRADVSLKTISRAEGGSGNLGTQVYDKIYKALDLTPYDVSRLMQNFTDSQPEAKVLSVC